MSGIPSPSVAYYTQLHPPPFLDKQPAWSRLPASCICSSLVLFCLLVLLLLLLLFSLGLVSCLCGGVWGSRCGRGGSLSLWRPLPLLLLFLLLFLSFLFSGCGRRP
ncbi:hypothetical protein V8C86DRAFT_2496519 [Haematococcus lacustris]